MKKLIFLLSILYSAMPASAQYSTASVSGPWIANDGSQPAYLIFDGNGNVNELGAAIDSLHPVGSDSISPSGAVSFRLNLIVGTASATGQMLNDSSFTVYDTIVSVHLAQHIYVCKVSNPGALSGVWSGTVYDSSSNYTRTIQLTVNGSGTITTATGIPLTTGRIFASRDSFAGYITSTDDSCAYKAIQIWGVVSGDSLKGPAQLGPMDTTHGSNCQMGGYAILVRASSGIADIPAIDFSVYPNPFTDQIDISVSKPGNKIQADLYDLCGRKVLSRPLDSSRYSGIDASMLGSGMYILALTGADGKTCARRIIKN
jgi:hypothetical protein